MLFLNLKNFVKSIRQGKLLLLALFFGLLLRSLNPTFGSPSLYVSNDEAIAHLSAFNMIATKTPVSIANYTPLGAYVQIPLLIVSFVSMKALGYVNNTNDFELFVLTHEGYFLFVPRLISAFFGTLTIIVIYKITKLLFGNRKTAITAAFLCTVSFNFVHASHFGRPWSVALFFMALALLFSLKKRVFVAYVSIALAYGFHQVGLLFLPLVFLLTFKNRSLKIALSIFICAVLVILFSNLTLKVGIIESIKNGQSFVRSNVLITDLLRGDFNIVKSILFTIRGNFAQNYLVNLLLTDGVLFLSSLLGILIVFRQRSKTATILIAYFLLYFIFASLFFHPLIRYLVPLLIILIPFAAYAIIHLLGRKSYLIVLLILLASINSLYWNYLFIKRPTFVLAHEWIEQNIPVDLPIAYMGGRFYTFTPNKTAIDKMQNFLPTAYERLEKILPNDNIENVRNIVYIGSFSGESKSQRLMTASKSNDFKYVVDYYLDPEDSLYLQNPNSFEVIAKFYPVKNSSHYKLPESLFDSNAKFPPGNYNSNISKFTLERMGPYFEVLKVKSPRL